MIMLQKNQPILSVGSFSHRKHSTYKPDERTQFKSLSFWAKCKHLLNKYFLSSLLLFHFGIPVNTKRYLVSAILIYFFWLTIYSLQ